MLSESMLYPFYELVHHDVNASKQYPEQLEYFDSIFAEMTDMPEEWIVNNLDALDYYMNADFRSTITENKLQEVGPIIASHTWDKTCIEKVHLKDIYNGPFSK